MTFQEWLNGWEQYGRIRMIQNTYFPDRWGLDQHPNTFWHQFRL